jgi:hypothetical protein
MQHLTPSVIDVDQGKLMISATVITFAKEKSVFAL